MQKQNLIKIETYWNVNTFSISPVRIHFWIKIETYWNVNYNFSFLFLNPHRIKIETYWNVNSFCIFSSSDPTSLK